LKKPAGSIRFYKQKTRKNRTEPKPKKTGKKPSQTGLNLFFPLKNRIEPKPVSLTRFRFGFVFFSKNNFGLITFFDKNRTKPKMITPNSGS
jgi:hypothetical protein